MNKSTTRRGFLKTMGGIAAVGMTASSHAAGAGGAPPNFIIVFTDDQGYRDVGCYGATEFETPNLDRLAAEGARFTQFYAAACVCTPSRAALLTGCYPQRVGLPSVLNPQATIGLSSEETIIPEMLKARNYATACIGKWHLGHHPEFLPTRHGFDEYFGLPYSNDMWPFHPKPEVAAKFPDLPLIDGEKVIELNPDQTQLTTRYTERAVQFIEKNHDCPFFIYLPHSMPHVPLFVSDKFAGKSRQGTYGDVIMEIDWSVGQIVATLERLNIARNTMIIFTSDNGPWLSYGNHAGAALPFRDGKHTTFEGGQREPCIMWYPGRIPAGTVCTEMATNMDLLPTIARLADVPLPKRPIDGKDIWHIITDKPGATSPHDAFYFYKGDELRGVRQGKWKLLFPHKYNHILRYGRDGLPGTNEAQMLELSLFDLEKDIAETKNIVDKHPDIVSRLTKLAEKFDDELQQTRRPPGSVPE
jgi:arylsulfatase A